MYGISYGMLLCVFYCMILSVTITYFKKMLSKVYVCWVAAILFKQEMRKWTLQLQWLYSLQWRHNERDGGSNHQPYDCLLNRLFRRRPTNTPKLRVTGLCEGNSPVTGEFPAQRASNAENVSIWWRHHVQLHWFGRIPKGPELHDHRLADGLTPAFAKPSAGTALTTKSSMNVIWVSMISNWSNKLPQISPDIFISAKTGYQSTFPKYQQIKMKYGCNLKICG